MIVCNNYKKAENKGDLGYMLWQMRREESAEGTRGNGMFDMGRACVVRELTRPPCGFDESNPYGVVRLCHPNPLSPCIRDPEREHAEP